MDDIHDYLGRIEDKLDRIDSKFDKIDARFDKVDNKLDLHTEHLSSLDITSAKQEKEISIHIEGVKTLKTQLDKEADKREEEISPLKRHVSFMRDSWKLLTMIGVAAATGMSIDKLIHIWSK